MEAITTILSLFMFIGLVLSPILIIRSLNKRNTKYKFIAYLSIGIVVTALLTVVFAWWSHTSDLMLLAYYGYNLDGMNETEYYSQVAGENMERVKSLETNIMGIGWPLKAIITFLIYIPYLFIVYLIAYRVQKNRKMSYT
jgi:xanthine/uracil permease